MVVSDANIHNIMGGMESTTGVRLHNHRRKLKQRFDIIKKLGQGTYGKVQLGINKETGQEVAIKTIKKAKIETEADLIRIRREIQIMSSVQHPNIIHIYEVFENREKMVLVMEYAAGGELYDYLSERKVLAEEEARRIFRQIATAVYYCHKHKICHRDLKLENILLDEHGSAKIADFGLSNVFDEQRLLNTFCGSPLYASPEIVKGTPYHGPEVDCWSLGVLLYTLVYGAMPFDGSNFKRLVKQISQGDYFEPKKPSPASPLIREMLTVNPARRADIEKICAHWWVNEGHADSCLDIAEELANQTPVRLDLLLSLAPPPPGVGSEKLLLTSEEGEGTVGAAAVETVAPVRCHSVGSLMDLDTPAAERKIREFERERESGVADILPPGKDAPKRKLEEGISTEDAARGGAKKKERNRRRDSEHSLDRKASARSSKPVENDTRQAAPSDVEMMDVDVDVTVTLPLPADAETSVQQVAESVKKVPSTLDNVTAEDNKTPAAEKNPEKESTNVTITAGKSNRKSVKKKSKPPTEGPPVNSESVSKKESSEQIAVTNEENCTKAPEETPPSAVEVNGEVSKVSDVGETVESVKPKLKKKKKVLNTSKSEVPSEQLPNGQEVLEQSSQITAENKLDSASVNSSQSVKSEETRTAPVSDISDADSKNSRETSEVKAAEAPKTSGIKTKKSRGELSLGKLNADKTSDEASPLSKPTERRRSKIFENADKFNVFLGGSPPEAKSPTSEKPKKVFIPGVKVSDFKQAFERRSSLSGPPASAERRSSLSSASQSSLVKQPAPKKPAEQSSKTVPKSDSTNSDTAAVGKPEVLAEPAPQTKQEQPLENETAAVQKDVNENASSSEVPAAAEGDSELKLVPALQVTDKASQQEKARIKKLKDAVDVISNAIAEETKRETGKKVSSAKPPVPSERIKSKSGSSSSSPKSPPLSPAEAAGAKKSPSGTKVAPEGAAAQTTKFPFDEAKAVSEEAVSQPEQEDAKQISQESPSSAEPASVEPPAPEKKKSAKVEITLKSATLPRRKTSKAEIQLGYPQVQAQPVPRAADKGSPAGEYRTEVEQMVGSHIPPRMQTQRSEVAFPVAAAATTAPLRSASMEPESSKSKPKERIIPIQVEKEPEEAAVQSPSQPTPPKPPVPPLQQRSMSQRSSSLSRQSTQDSDTDSTISASGPEPIRKSPREYIIPIAMEGGGYVTPRASSLEPSESTTESTRRSRRSSGRLSRPRRMSSLLSDSGASEDEGFNSLSSPFGTLHRHSSLGRDGENPDDDMPFRHMHKLRSSRPKQATLEHNDSFSSAEEDDDDGFEILTAESLFSTLLSRVRSLTQRLNVEDGGRPGFPSSRLLGHLGSPSPGFWSSSREPISRRVSEGSRFSHSSFGHDGDNGSSTPWRRSQTREPSECESTYSEAGNSTNEGTLPRGSSRSERGSFSEEAGSDISSCASYYTPSLARRLQHHRHASSEDVRDQDDDWSLTSPMRKSSLGMLPSYRTTVTQPTNSPSRRLSRTLSMRTSTDTRGRDYYSSASVGADRRRISDLSSPSSYSSSLLGTQESIKKDYLPPTRRSLHMLDSRNTSSIPKYKGSSASDSGDYSYRSRVTDYDRVLPPLPYSASTRKESLRSLYARQRSLDSSASSYGGSRHIYSRIQEEVQERPHHSSSVPLVGGSTTEGKAAHLHSRRDEYKTEKSSNFNPKSTFTSDKHENEDNSTSLKDDDSKTNMDQESSSSTSAKKGRQIPSLLRLRSSSASRELNKENKDSKESQGKLPRSSSMSNSTPDRSVLGKFLGQSSEGRDVSSQENEEGKKKVRKISRFLRPDFYDTPREESIYAKEQDAKKAAEAEAKLKRRKSLKKTESISSQNQIVDNNSSAALAPSNPESSAVKDAVQSTSKKHKEKETKLANIKKSSTVSETRKEPSSPAFEKQCSTSPTKSGFLHSLEKKLIKFKSSGDDIPVVTSSGKSRIDKAIHSLREKSLTPRGSDIVTTESHLLKRAVSVDDCSTADGANSPTNTGSKLGNRVTSVLGLFRKYEDAPTKGTHASPPRTSVLSRLRRTQSVYAGSQSDSVLTGNENVTSQKKSPQDSQNLKKTQSNSSLGNKNISKNSVQTDASKQKIPSISTKSKKSPEKSVKVSKRLEENINMNTVSIHPNVKTKENTSSTTEPAIKDVANPPGLFVHDSQATVMANCNSNDNVTSTTAPPQQIVNVLSDVPKTFNEEQVVESINRLSKQESQDQETVFLTSKNHTPITREQPAENMGTNNNIIGSRISNSSTGNKKINLTTEGSVNNVVLSLKNLKVMPPDVLPDDVSPTDELESLDSWSVCSDLECHDFPMSPILPPGDETESVGDRIHRKSFYTRFNDVKKKHRKPSLTSLGTLSSSLREPNSFYAKKRHHSSELALQNNNLKPHRSKSLSTDNGYGVLPERKSPIPSKGSKGATPLMNGCDDLVNGSLAEENCPQPDDSHTNGGSREILRLPRHFNSNVNLSYNVPSKQNFLRRASDTRLSRSTESNIGGAFQKSRLPTPVNQVSKVCTTSDNESRLGSSKLDTLPLHGKYKRCNSENAEDPQLPTAENQDGSAVTQGSMRNNPGCRKIPKLLPGIEPGTPRTAGWCSTNCATGPG